VFTVLLSIQSAFTKNYWERIPDAPYIISAIAVDRK
jgi:hypothetical protein